LPSVVLSLEISNLHLYILWEQILTTQKRTDLMSSGDNNKGPWGNLGGGNKPQKPSNPLGGGSSGGGGGDNKSPFNFDNIFKKGPNTPQAPEINIDGRGIILIALLILAGWLVTGFYMVDASEEGTVLRFGKYHRTATEGLRYHIPSPIEKVYIVKKTAINSIQIGYRSSMNQKQATSARGIKEQLSNLVAFSPEMKNAKESLMITGDTNIADVSFTIQWRIKDSFNYLFKVANAEDGMDKTIKAVAESAMREVVGRTNFAEAMTTKRGNIEKEVQEITQSVLNTYESGVEVYAVNLNDVQNPEPVMPAFLDVETAKQDRETSINRARSYENEIIPRARGETQKIIQDAEAYKQEVISIATGEAARFASVYTEYLKAKDVTKKRMYLETMQQVMAGTDKVILEGSRSGNNSGVTSYLPLPEIKRRAKAEEQPINENDNNNN
jgi:modulator of FtsH protease HflK